MNIAEINEKLWRERRRRPFIYVALVFERERLRGAVRGFWEEREGELREMQGVGRWGRVVDLRG